MSTEDEPSKHPRTDAVWARHEGTTTACCADILQLSMILEEENAKFLTSLKILEMNGKAVINTLKIENERLKDKHAKAANDAALSNLKVALMEQDFDVIRRIITKGGPASDVLKFLDTPLA